MNYDQAKKIADKYVAELAPFCHRIEVAGSIRRKKQADIKDVEIVLIPDMNKLVELRTWFGKQRRNKGNFPGKYVQLKNIHCDIDIFITTIECWGSIFFIRTGSAEFVKSVVSHAPECGLRFHEGRLRSIDSHSGQPLGFIYTPQEKDVFQAMGMPWMEPEHRNKAIRWVK